MKVKVKWKDIKNIYNESKEFLSKYPFVGIPDFITYEIEAEPVEEVKECEHKSETFLLSNPPKAKCNKCGIEFEPELRWNGLKWKRYDENKVERLHDHQTLNEIERGLESILNEELDNIYRLIQEMRK